MTLQASDQPTCDVRVDNGVVRGSLDAVGPDIPDHSTNFSNCRAGAFVCWIEATNGKRQFTNGNGRMIELANRNKRLNLRGEATLQYVDVDIGIDKQFWSGRRGCADEIKVFVRPARKWVAALLGFDSSDR